VQSLLAAKTKQEVEAIVAEAFDTAESLEDPLEALLRRSSSRTNAIAGAAAGAAGVSAGGVSSLGGASTFSTQSTSTEKLSADIASYKQQIVDLQTALNAKADAAAAATPLSADADKTVLKLEQKLAATEAEKALAQAAQQELQQQKAAAEEAQQQLLLQINVLSQEAEQLKQTNTQLAQAQAADGELLLRSNTLQRELDAAQKQLQDMQLEKLVLQQQVEKVAALEAQVLDLQQQLQQLLAQKRATHDATSEADMVSRCGRSKEGNVTTGSSAAVSAVRAATHSLLLQSNPFEVGALLAVELTAIALCAGGSPAQTMNVRKLMLGQKKRCNAVVCPAAKLL
jgi:chromosome segregation ATPase